MGTAPIRLRKTDWKFNFYKPYNLEILMEKKQCLLAIALGLMVPSLAQAQNPIIHDQFTADPTARVFEGKMYLYPSHDIVSPVEPERKWFSMADYHVFSSENLVDWTDHGVIVDQNDVPWVKPNSYSMWAPDCVYKDGTYYFYFPSAPKEGRGFAVGVATSSSPAGPFTPMDKPIAGVNGIDPCVLQSSDGNAYIFWAGGGLRMAKLKDNLVELDSEPQVVEGLPEGFKEGPFAFERQGKYYLTFPWVQDKTETLAYAMSDHPMGPYTFKGVIMEQSPTGCWTNHHSIVEYKGQWYLFYHHNDYSPEFDKLRSARIDSLFFNNDGTIRPVTATLRGVGITDARSHVQIDRYSHITPGASIAYLDENDKFKGWKTVFDQANAAVTYNRIDFGSGSPKKVTLRVKSDKGGQLGIRLSGLPDLTVKVPGGSAWTEVSASVSSAPTGLRDLTVSLAGGDKVEVDWISWE